MSILRMVIVAAVLVGVTGCQSAEPKSSLTENPFVAEARRVVGPPWTDQELVTLGAIACSSAGSVSDMSTKLKAERSALDYREARAIADAAATHMCPR